MQNSGSSRNTKYDAAMSIFVDGSSAKKLETAPGYWEQRRMEEEERRRQLRERRKAAQAMKVARRKAAVRAMVFAVAGVVVMAIAVVALSCVVRNNSLSRDISRLEAELSEIKAQNDSKQYDIDSSVDIATVIAEAGKLGMVRGTAEQIRYYDSGESEFLKKVAEIPRN